MSCLPPRTVTLQNGIQFRISNMVGLQFKYSQLIELSNKTETFLHKIETTVTQGATNN